MDEPEGDTKQDNSLVTETSTETNEESSKMESEDKEEENHVIINSSGNEPTDKDDGLNDGEEEFDGSLSEIEDSPDVIVLDSDDDDDLYTNPEPSKELLHSELINADTIGDTVFSKHWLFTTLMNLIKAVDAEEHAKDNADTSELGLDLEDSLQDELCKLWDMSMDPAVVSLLMDFKAIDLLTGVVSKSKAPRAVEICVGILGNMACTEVACKAISLNDKLRTLILVLLESPDAPTLVESTRLLYTCMSSAPVYDLWMTSVRDMPSVYNSLLFILRSSTNNDLLSHTADLIDKVMDTEDDLLIQWSSSEMVQAVLEAVKQCRSNREALDTFLHILQLVSTCDAGIEALGSNSKNVCDLTLQYLIRLCSEDILILDGQENALGCVLCVLTTAFQALEDKAKFIVSDFQLIRCLLKILNVIYPRVRNFTPKVQRHNSRDGQRSRSQSLNISENQPSRSDSLNESNQPKSPSNDGDKRNTESDVITDPSSEPVKETKSNSPQPEGSQVHKTEESQTDKEDSSKPNVVVDEGALEMLYEVLQNLLVDVVLLVSEENEMSSMAEDSPRPDTCTASGSDNTAKSHYNIPQTLIYLNDLCDRQRLQMLVYTMDEVLQDTEMDCCGRLRQAAQNHKFSRLESIVDEYSAG